MRVERNLNVEELNKKENQPARGSYCFPRWLERLLEEDQEMSSRNTLLDHQRHSGKIAFCEPYGASDKDFEALVAFCKRHDLRFAVAGHSNHNVGFTFRVTIWREGDEREARAVSGWFGK